MAAFAYALLNEQLADLIRRWSVLQLVVSAALAASLAFAVWIVTRRLLVRGPWEPQWLHDGADAAGNASRRKTRRRVRDAAFAIVVAAAAIQLVLHLLTEGSSRRAGWGIVVPAGVLAVIAGLGLLSRSISDDEPRVKDVGPPYPDVPNAPIPRLLAAAALVAFGFGLVHATFGYAVYTRQWSFEALVPPAAAATGAIVAHLVRRGYASMWAVVAALAATLVLQSFDGHDAEPSVIVALGVVFAAAGAVLYGELAQANAPRASVPRPWIGALLALLVAFAAALIAAPLALGQALSVVGVLALFLISFAIFLAVVLWVQPAIPLPRAVYVVGFRQFPIVFFLLLWFVLAARFDGGGFHDLRMTQTQTAAAAPNLGQALDCWLAKNGIAAGRCADVADVTSVRKATPLVLVASTGGGVRAAYWTALVLDCTFEVGRGGVAPRRPCLSPRRNTFTRSNSLFAVSGISGGSVGFAAYAAHLVEKRDRGGNERWIADRLDPDGLSPLGLWWLFVELPRVFLQFQIERDRSEILEHIWEREWPEGELGRGVFDLWRTSPQIPLLFLNGTSVDDGCRFSSAVLNANIEGRRQRTSCRAMSLFDELDADEPLGTHSRLNPNSVLPATRELADYVCGEIDVPLSSVAFLSARFPFVNPSGRVESRCDAEGRRPVTYVVDGGYLDTSGASPLVELANALTPLIERRNRREGDRCIVPFFVQIDNGFEGDGSERVPPRPLELLVPLKTSFATRHARAAEARSEAALVFNASFSGATLGGKPLRDRYAHFVNQAHPGPRAPLGWAQSQESERELRAQLRQPKNLAALKEVRGWFAAAESGRLSCTGR